MAAKRAQRRAKRNDEREKQLRAREKAAKRMEVLNSRQVNARYDLAQTSANNRNHWSWADNLNAAQANSRGVRTVLRNRARYERANNGYIDGITSTYAIDLVGTGPMVELTADGMPIDDRQAVERRFHGWMRAADIADKLRTAREGRTTDGESFGIMMSNERVALKDSFVDDLGREVPGVSLDLLVVEADQCTNPTIDIDGGDNEVDGILYDDLRNPITYRFLDIPIDGLQILSTQTKDIPWQFVIHDFTPRRAGQVRGIPEFTSTLALGANLRDMTMATVDCAKSAAYWTAVLYSESPVEGDEEQPEGFEEIELQRNMATTLPAGWQIGQVKAEHPTSTYPEFKREIISETARPINMPYNVAAGDSSDYNFASGRLDHQTYDRTLDTDRDHMNRVWMERLFRAWREEARRIPGYLPDSFTSPSADWQHSWQWEKRGHIDPLKEASAEDVQLGNFSSNLREIYRKRNKDYRTEVRQRLEEIREIREGLVSAGFEDPTVGEVLAMMRGTTTASLQMASEDDE